MNVVRHVIFMTTIHQVSALFAGRGTDIVSFCNNGVCLCGENGNCLLRLRCAGRLVHLLSNGRYKIGT